MVQWCRGKYHLFFFLYTSLPSYPIIYLSFNFLTQSFIYSYIFWRGLFHKLLIRLLESICICVEKMKSIMFLFHPSSLICRQTVKKDDTLWTLGLLYIKKQTSLVVFLTQAERRQLGIKPFICPFWQGNGAKRGRRYAVKRLCENPRGNNNTHKHTRTHIHTQSRILTNTQTHNTDLHPLT